MALVTYLAIAQYEFVGFLLLLVFFSVASEVVLIQKVILSLVLSEMNFSYLTHVMFASVPFPKSSYIIKI